MKKSVAWMTGGVMALAIVAASGALMSVHADNGSEGGDNGNGLGNLNLPVLANVNASSVLSTASGTLPTFSVQNPGGEGAQSEGQSQAQNQNQGEGQGQNQNQGEGQGSQGMNDVQESISLNANGNFKITGAKVVSVDTAAGTITATLYGFTKTVNVSGAAITGGNATMTLGTIQAGDVLSATGNFNEATHAVTVNTVNDVSSVPNGTSAIQSRLSMLMQLVAQLQAQLQAVSGGN